MASTFEAFKELDLTRDEVERIGDALKDGEFRKLLSAYVEEIRNPENRKLYEQEVAQLEKERGMDVTFINPVPGYVIKTSANGSQKAFINIAANDHVGRPSSTPIYAEGSRGLQWSLPHTLSPPRDDYDSKRNRCLIYDVVFHPDALRLAKNNKKFKDMVNSTALESIEKNFNVVLDKKNYKLLTAQYKGMDHASVIRTPSKSTLTSKSAEEQEFLDQIFSHIPKSKNTVENFNSNSKKAANITTAIKDDPQSKYTIPKYVIKHRSHVDMQEFTYDRNAKGNVAIPKELVVEVFLPMLRGSQDITLDVTEKTIQIISESPAKYKLNITLPYSVNNDCGNAKFEKDVKKLIVTLPVKRNKHFLITDVNSIDDSGVESDHGSPKNGKIIEDLSEISEKLNRTSKNVKEEADNNDLSESNKPELEKESIISESEITDFFGDLDYTLPEHFCQLERDNMLSFTFKVKNVNESSITKHFLDSKTLFLKFTSISSGFFPINYGAILKLTSGHFDEDDVEIEAWDNNVIAQLTLVQSKSIESYFYGSNYDNLVETFLDKAQITANSTNLGEKVTENCVKNGALGQLIVDTTLGTKSDKDQCEENGELVLESKLKVGEYDNKNSDIVEEVIANLIVSKPGDLELNTSKNSNLKEDLSKINNFDTKLAKSDGFVMEICKENRDKQNVTLKLEDFHVSKQNSKNNNLTPTVNNDVPSETSKIITDKNQKSYQTFKTSNLPQLGSKAPNSPTKSKSMSKCEVQPSIELFNGLELDSSKSDHKNNSFLTNKMEVSSNASSDKSNVKALMETSSAYSISSLAKSNTIPISRNISSPTFPHSSASCSSSSDEPSLCCSPVNAMKSKGILKRLRTARTNLGRSISESGLDDDALWMSSSMENYSCYSMESVIPEEEVEAGGGGGGGACSVGGGGSLKKTVRFNENISQQLYRSNSSILGQKKKNQRKARNKKRAQERRHSESEVSGAEDNGNTVVVNGNTAIGCNKEESEGETEQSDNTGGKETQFDLDM